MVRMISYHIYYLHIERSFMNSLGPHNATLCLRSGEQFLDLIREYQKSNFRRYKTSILLLIKIKRKNGEHLFSATGRSTVDTVIYEVLIWAASRPRMFAQSSPFWVILWLCNIASVKASRWDPDSWGTAELMQGRVVLSLHRYSAFFQLCRSSH